MDVDINSPCALYNGQAMKPIRINVARRRHTASALSMALLSPCDYPVPCLR
jgi:hypothetical protein